MNEIIKNLESKKILILGFGREGQSTYKFLRRKFPSKFIGIADQKNISDFDASTLRLIKKDKNLKTHFGKNYLNFLKDYKIIVKSPGIPSKLPEVREAKKLGFIFSSQTQLFFDLCKGIIIGITGTKGKSTTSSLVYSVLKGAGEKTILLGNIGTPALDYLNLGSKKTYYVYELSSHQLADIKKSPHIAIFLNIFREHLDYYESYKQYFQAKSKITSYQTQNDFFIYNASFEILRKLAKKTRARSFGFSVKENNFTSCFVRDNYIVYRKGSNEDKILSTDKVPLKGEHNLGNVMAAILAGKVFGLHTRQITKAIKKFKPLEHRLQKVGTCRGIAFIDDSLATIPEATIAAIDTFKSKIGTLILGGSERGQDYKDLAAKILEQRIDNVILFPVTGVRIWEEIHKKSRGNGLQPKHFFAHDMKKAVDLSFVNTKKGKICLLSTAAPSFSLFRDYKEKAALFRKHILEYKPGVSVRKASKGQVKELKVSRDIHEEG